MARRTDLKIPYGIADFKTIRTEGCYYVDKTSYLAKLEERDSFVFFVRPRRFGKSLFLDMLRLYYDRNEKASFDRIFMTGVSPVTMDDLTSGFNIATNISQDGAFNSMLGFSEAETLQIYRDFKGVGEFQEGAQNILPLVTDLVKGVPFEILLSFDVDRIARQDVFPTFLQNEGIIVPVRRYQGRVYYSFPNIAASLTYLSLIGHWRRDNDRCIVELKHSAADASEVELRAKADEGIAKLRQYASDPSVPDLAKDTELHLILFQFRGFDLHRLEEIPQ